MSARTDMSMKNAKEVTVMEKPVKEDTQNNAESTPTPSVGSIKIVPTNILKIYRHQHIKLK